MLHQVDQIELKFLGTKTFPLLILSFVGAVRQQQLWRENWRRSFTVINNTTTTNKRASTMAVIDAIIIIVECSPCLCNCCSIIRIPTADQTHLKLAAEKWVSLVHETLIEPHRKRKNERKSGGGGQRNQNGLLIIFLLCPFIWVVLQMFVPLLLKYQAL